MHMACVLQPSYLVIYLYYGHQMSKVHWNGLCYAQKLLTKFTINDWLAGMHNYNG